MLILVIHGQLNTLVVYLELGDQTSQQLIYIIELVCCTVTYIYIYIHTQSARGGLILVVRKVQNQVGILKKKRKRKKVGLCFHVLIFVIHGQLNVLVVYLELGDQTSHQLIQTFFFNINIYIYILF